MKFAFAVIPRGTLLDPEDEDHDEDAVALWPHREEIVDVLSYLEDSATQYRADGACVVQCQPFL